ncbi:MAG: prepilin-type N-terminal cleavage/methylation domain-containing protein [Nitrospirae bacterium]|nr:prepilin-type N-terminal cleavage/methylation domain-containing protein [Nitrospirota bacterium]
MLKIGKISRLVKLDREKGFTLIELMIVVAILGILAAIAIPNFMRFQAKSKQSEAKTNLGGIGTTAEAWRTENDTYIATAAQLGWAPQGATRYGYSYNALLLAANTTAGNCATSGAANAAAVAAAATFIAVADGDVDNDATCDVWQYNQLRALTNTTNDVSG